MQSPSFPYLSRTERRQSGKRTDVGSSQPRLSLSLQNQWSCDFAPTMSPHGLTFTWWGCCGLCLWHIPNEIAYSFLFCSCVCFCLYHPFNCISFHKFSQQLSAFSLCSSGLISALLVLSTIYLLMKVSLSPDINLCGGLGLKRQPTN